LFSSFIFFTLLWPLSHLLPFSFFSKFAVLKVCLCSFHFHSLAFLTNSLYYCFHYCIFSCFNNLLINVFSRSLLLFLLRGKGNFDIIKHTLIKKMCDIFVCI
jgi:hypothetical protein